jgi:hypothetical protein
VPINGGDGRGRQSGIRSRAVQVAEGIHSVWWRTASSGGEVLYRGRRQQKQFTS